MKLVSLSIDTYNCSPMLTSLNAPYVLEDTTEAQIRVGANLNLRGDNHG
jgi:hypothetical protein